MQIYQIIGTSATHTGLIYTTLTVQSIHILSIYWRIVPLFIPRSLFSDKLPGFKIKIKENAF